MFEKQDGFSARLSSGIYFEIRLAVRIAFRIRTYILRPLSLNALHQSTSAHPCLAGYNHIELKTQLPELLLKVGKRSNWSYMVIHEFIKDLIYVLRNLDLGFRQVLCSR